MSAWMTAPLQTLGIATGFFSRMTDFNPWVAGPTRRHLGNSRVALVMRTGWWILWREGQGKLSPHLTQPDQADLTTAWGEMPTGDKTTSQQDKRTTSHNKTIRQQQDNKTTKKDWLVTTYIEQQAGGLHGNSLHDCSVYLPFSHPTRLTSLSAPKRSLDSTFADPPCRLAWQLKEPASQCEVFAHHWAATQTIFPTAKWAAAFWLGGSSVMS